LSRAQLRRARYGNVNAGCRSTRNEQCVAGEAAIHDARVGVGRRIVRGDSHKREAPLETVSFTGQKRSFATLPCNPDKWIKIVDNQLFSSIFSARRDPTGAPLLRKSIAGECGVRVTAFCGISCMVQGSRAVSALGNFL
jgi:hypothetical protein